MEEQRYFNQNQPQFSSINSNSNNAVGFIHDMKNLFSTWQQSQRITFSDFKDIWKQLQFSYIHRGSAPNLDPLQYTQALFQVCIQFLLRHNNEMSLSIRVGAIYCLYCLYNTQVVEPKQNIVQSIASWQEMLKVYGEMKEHKLLDGIFIWRKMKDEHYFIFSSTLPIDPFSSTTPNSPSPSMLSNLPSEVINTDTLAINKEIKTGVVDLDLIDDVASRYMQAKSTTTGHTISPSEAPSLNVINPRLVGDIKQLLEHDRPHSENY